MSNLVTQGRIIHKLEPQTGAANSGKEWKKQDFVIETFDEYPKKICFECWNSTVEHLDNRNVGDNVQVSFNPESREYNERWYTSLKCWKIELL